MLKDRVTQLIEQFHGGTVYAAAKGWGVPLQTLYRIASGQTPNPRASVLARIAEACEVSVEWLLSGKGPGPTERDSYGFKRHAATLRWEGIVGRLSLSDEARFVVESLPYSGPLSSFMRLGQDGKSRIPPGYQEFLDGSLALWSGYLETVTEKYGPKAVGEALSADSAHAALGFTMLSSWLLGMHDLGKAIKDTIPTLISDVRARKAKAEKSLGAPTERDVSGRSKGARKKRSAKAT